MKTILRLFVFVFSFNLSFSQVISVDDSSNMFYVSTSLRSNLSGASNLGMGLRVSAGYNINDDFSLMLSTGYMTSYTDPNSYITSRGWDNSAGDFLITTISNGRKEHRFIPVDLSLKYNFNVFGIQSYALVQAGWEFYINEGNYSVSTQTRYESSNELMESTNGLASDLYNVPKTNARFGFGLGFGVLIPVTKSMKLDMSYLYLSNLGIHSIGLGLNFGIK